MAGVPIAQGARSASEHMGEGRRDRTRAPTNYCAIRATELFSMCRTIPGTIEPVLS